MGRSNSMQLAKEAETSQQLNAQVRSLANLEDERAQQWKNQESSLMFELMGARKKAEFEELKREDSDNKLEVVVRESETMRRVFESSLKEADSVATMLKEQLEIVRNTMNEQAVASDQEIKKLKEALDAANQDKSDLELAKFKSEVSLRDDLTNMQATAEEVQLQKEQLASRLRGQTEEMQRSRDALSASVSEAELLSKELEAAERRCASIQREAEQKCAAAERAKIAASKDMLEEIARNKGLANQAYEEKMLAEKKLKSAEASVSKAKYELGTTLQEAQRLRMEQEEAGIVLDLLDGQLADVRETHHELVSEADEIVSASRSSLSLSRKMTSSMLQ